MFEMNVENIRIAARVIKELKLPNSVRERVWTALEYELFLKMQIDLINDDGGDDNA